MKSTVKKSLGVVLGLLFTVFFMPTFVSAQNGIDVLYQQPVLTSVTDSFAGSAFFQRLGTGLTGEVGTLIANGITRNDNGAPQPGVNWAVYRFDDSSYVTGQTSMCSGGTANVPNNATTTVYIGVVCDFDLDPTKYYGIQFTNTNVGVRFQVYGSAVLNGWPQLQYISGGNFFNEPTLANAYFVLAGDFAPLIAYEGVSGISTSSVTQFCSSSFSTTSVGILSSIASGFSYGLCAVGAFLFIPDQTVLQQFSTLASTTKQKFPFNYVAQVADTWDSLQASSTANSPIWTFGLHDLGIGSTTPLGNILPNSTVFSSTTVTSYFPPGSFEILKALAAIALIMGLIADIFFTSRNLLH